MLVNVHWGLQRVIAARWAFNTHLGVGYAVDLNSRFGTIYPALDLNYSYILLGLKRKKREIRIL